MCVCVCFHAAAIIGPIAVAILVVGNSAVIIGLWPAHFLWTYYCVAKWASYEYIQLLSLYKYMYVCMYVCLYGLFRFYVCVFSNIRSKKLGLVLKIVVLVLLPLPVVLWPVLGIVASLLGGIGYGNFAPLIATFEARGQNFRDKFYHCFAVCFLFPLLHNAPFLLVCFSEKCFSC